MNAILMTAVMVATLNNPSMQLDAIGTVYPCIGNTGTCFKVNGQRWGLEHVNSHANGYNTGDRIKVRFTMSPIETDDGDAFRVTGLEILGRE